MWTQKNILTPVLFSQHPVAMSSAAENLGWQAVFSLLKTIWIFWCLSPKRFYSICRELVIDTAQSAQMALEPIKTIDSDAIINGHDSIDVPLGIWIWIKIWSRGDPDSAVVDCHSTRRHIEFACRLSEGIASFFKLSPAFDRLLVSILPNS